MNHNNNHINETSKYLLFAGIFLVFTFLAFSALAAADENISTTETTVLATDTTIENVPTTTISELLPDSSVPENPTTTTLEETSVPEESSEEIEPTTTIPEVTEPTVPDTTISTIEETTTTIDEREPIIEARLSSSRVVRGSIVSITATLKNTGTGAANITGVEFNLPAGFAIFSANYDSCKSIEPGQECSFPLELSTSIETARGKNRIGLVVKYE